MPQLYDLPPTAEPPRRRKRPPLGSENSAYVSYMDSYGALPSGGNTDFAMRLGASEKWARSFAPPDMVYAMAYVATEDAEAAQLGALIAREVDLPRLIERRKGRPVPLLNPTTGEPLQLRDIRRMRNYRRAELGAALAQGLVQLAKEGFRVPIAVPRGDPELRGQTYTDLRRIPVERFNTYYEALGSLPGRMNATSAVNAVLQLAASGTDPERFRMNLDIIKNWNGATGPFDETYMVGLAQFWTDTHGDVIRGQDLIGIANPNLAVSERPADVAELSRTTVGNLAVLPGAGLISKEQEATLREYQVAYDQAGKSAARMSRLNDATNMLVNDVIAEREGFVAGSFGNMLEALDVAWTTTAGTIWGTANLLTLGTIQQAIGGSPNPGDLWDNTMEGLKEAADMVMRERRPGDIWATTMGFTPGTFDHQVVSFGSEFLVGWYLDPFVITGQVSRATQMRRLIASSDAETFRGLGLFGGLRTWVTKPEQVMDRLDALGTALVRPNWVARLNMPKGYKMTFPEWMVRQSVARMDEAAKLPRGIGLFSEGVDRRVLQYIQRRTFDYPNITSAGDIPQQLIDEAWDIFLVGAGRKGATEVGQRFNTFLNRNTLGSTTTELQEAVKSVFRKRKPAFKKDGMLTARSERSIRNALADALTAAGVRGKRVGTLVERFIKNVDQDVWEVIREGPAEASVRLVNEHAASLVKGIPAREVEALARREHFALGWADEVWGLPTIEGAQRVIPRIHGIGVALRDLRLGFKDSQFWRSRAGRFISSFWEKAARPVAYFEDYKADEFFEYWLRELGVTDLDYLSGARARFNEIARFEEGVAREQHWANFMRAVLRHAYERELGLPPEMVEELLSDVMPRYFKTKMLADEFYGYRERAVIDKLTGRESIILEKIDTPPLDTMLLNTFLLPDPSKVRLGIRRALSGVDEVTEVANRLGVTDLMNASKEDFADIMQVLQEERTLMRAFRIKGGKLRDDVGVFMGNVRAAWVDSVLLRPGWQLKVIPDENFRALVQMHELGDRLRAVNYLAKAGERAKLITSRKIAVRLRDGTTGEIDLGISGLWPDDPAALQGIEADKAFKGMAWRQARIHKQLAHTFETVKPDAGMFYFEQWAKTLNMRVNQSPLGEKILKMLAGHVDDDGTVWTIAKLRAWARTNARAQALVQQGENLDEAVNRAIDYVSYLVRGEKPGTINPDLVRLALGAGPDGKAVEPQLLRRLTKNYPKGQLPELAIVNLEDAIRYSSSWGGKFVKNMYDHLMRTPSAVINRQPLMKALWQRELDRIIKLARDRGHEFTDAEIDDIAHLRMTNPMVATAKQYALNKELSTMFSYMDHTRFAEAHRFLWPFFSAYQEQFTVWSRLTWENPHIIGRVRLLAEMAHDTGFVEKDPLTGEWSIDSVPLGIALAFATLFRPTTAAYIGLGTIALGEGTELVVNHFAGPALEKFDMPNIEWLTPVASLNIFLQQPLSIPLGATDVYVPTPGMGMPGVDWMIQSVIDLYPESWPGQARVMAWATQYGRRGPSILPSSWNRIFGAVFKWDSPSLQAMKENMVDMIALGAQEPLDPRKLDQQAEDMARQLLLVRGLLQLLTPSAPQPRFESQEVRDEWQTLLDLHGPAVASKMMKERYPNNPDILLALSAHTYWTAQLAPGSPIGPSTPPNEAVSAILANPEFAKAAQRHPELAFFLIPSEFRDIDAFDYNAYSEQLASGMREFAPVAVYHKGELVGGRVFEQQISEGWADYYAALGIFEVALSNNGDPESNDQVYKELYAKYMKPAIEDISETNPAWGTEFTEVQTGQDPWFQQSMDMLRMVSGLPLWRDTAFGKSIREYFTLTDPLRVRMYQRNITAQSNAGQDILEQKDLIVAELSERYGQDFEIAYDTWLSQDLKFVDVRRDRRAQNLPERWITRWQVPWEEDYDAARQLAFAEATTSVQQRQGFLALRRLAMRAYEIEEATGLNPLEERWMAMNPDQKEQERLETMLKPYVFLTAFERRKILGIRTSNATEQVWENVEERKLEVYRAIEADPDNERLYWDRYNTWVEEQMRANPIFAREVHRNQRWAWTLWERLPEVKPNWYKGKEGEVWRDLQKVTEGIHDLFHKADFVDDGEFAEVQGIVADAIEQWREVSPDFDKHYSYLQGLSGDLLLDTLVPEFWWIAA